MGSTVMLNTVGAEGARGYGSGACSFRVQVLQHAHDHSSNHGSRLGEDPVAEDAFLSQRLGFLRHSFQLLDQDVSVKSAGDLGPESVNCGDDHFALGLLE